MPPPYRRDAVPPRAIERLAAGIGHQLELHAPGRAEVDPALALARAAARGGFGHHVDVVFPQVRKRGVQVVDVQRDVMPADVAVARRDARLLGCRVLEHLEDRLSAAAVEMQPLHDRAGVDAEMVGHPIGVVVPVRAERVEVLASDHVDEEPVGLAEVGDGDADVVDAAQSRQPVHHCTATYFDSV